MAQLVGEHADLLSQLRDAVQQPRLEVREDLLGTWVSWPSASAPSVYVAAARAYNVVTKKYSSITLYHRRVGGPSTQTSRADRGLIWTRLRAYT